MESKKIKFALFYWESDYADLELPEGCPDEYALPKLEWRIALAEWFMTEGITFLGKKVLM